MRNCSPKRGELSLPQRAKYLFNIKKDFPNSRNHNWQKFGAELAADTVVGFYAIMKRGVCYHPT
jgi:hypothetical protein